MGWDTWKDDLWGIVTKGMDQYLKDDPGIEDASGVTGPKSTPTEQNAPVDNSTTLAGITTWVKSNQTAVYVGLGIAALLVVVVAVKK